MISIHAPRKGVRHVLGCIQRPVFRISIHAPRKGVRLICQKSKIQDWIISIHAPRKGVRPFHRLVLPANREFQSTHPARGCDFLLLFDARSSSYFNPRTPQGGATSLQACNKEIFTDFNPRTPQGGATNDRRGMAGRSYISIHAPRKGVRPYDL